MITFVLQISSSAVSAPLVLATQLTRTRQILAPATPTAYRLPPTAPPPCPTTPLSVAVGGSGCGQIKSEMNVHPCDIVCFTLAANHRFYPPSLSVCCPFLLTNTTTRK